MKTTALFFVIVFSLCISSFSAFAAEENKKIPAADRVADGQPIDITSARYKGLFKELRLRHNFSEEELAKLFAGTTIKKRVLELMDKQWEARPYYEYWPIFITRDVIREGRKKLEENRSLLDAIEKKIGVEREVIVAIWGIETRYGKHKGGFNMFQTLNTMFDAYPRRRAFYRQQLVHFLLLCRENNIDPLNIPGSYGGAFGQTQFIPSSFREYAVDFNNDGSRDVWKSIPDVLASIANYLHRFHWTFGAPVYWELGDKLKGAELQAAYEKGRKGYLPWKQVRKLQGVNIPQVKDDKKVTIVGLELNKKGKMRFVAGYPNFQAITAWNHSNRYAMAVTELAEKLK
ncbi:MAG: lytic murein transglycosylase [Desulfobulbaceae bacterium]|nr:lytic murein transglycosylase [Desulfobulbaceae bacterium]